LNLQERRELYDGFGETLATAFELVVTPLLFGFLGHLLDRAAGTKLLFTILFVVLAIVGLATKMYYGYVEDMKVHQARIPGAKGDGS
jgi:F0F1-type ATP synthase assembly protein I